MSDETPILDPGDILACANGHHVLRCVAQVRPGMHVQAVDFKSADPRLADPKVGGILPRCPECDGPVFDGAFGGLRAVNIIRAKA